MKKEHIDKIIELYTAGCSVANIQTALLKEKKCVISKDLYNFIQNNLKSPDDDSVDKAIKLLRDVHRKFSACTRFAL